MNERKASVLAAAGSVPAVTSPVRPTAPANSRLRYRLRPIQGGHL